MTVQVHTAGPGVESHRSSRFAATVNGTSAYVYSRSRTTEYYSFGLWEAGDTVEVSCFTYGADETTTVAISLVGGSITSAVVYPKAHGITATVAGGTATITVTVGNLRKPLRVEVNGDRANVLYIHPHALKSSVPGGAVTFDGSQTSVPAGTALRFPAGVWDLVNGDGDQHKFPVGTGATVYLDDGSVVNGTLSAVTGDTMATGVSIRGPGILCGDFITNEEVGTTFAELSAYSMIFGDATSGATVVGSGNSVSEITILSAPTTSIGGTAINTVSDVHIYSPWTNNTDGMRVMGDPANANIATVSNCSMWVGDDAMVVERYCRHVTVSSLFVISSYSSAINLGYQSPDVDYGWTTTFDDVWTIPVQGAADDGGAIVQCWVDETTAGGAAGNGRYRVTIDGLTVEGSSMQCPLFWFANKLNPWGTSYDRAGNIAQFTISNVSVEATPATRSMLIGLDADNTPHDMTFADITIGGVAVTTSNWTTYVEQNAYPYNITLDDDEPPQGANEPEFVVEDGTGLDDANSYCSLDTADAYHTRYSNPTAWTSLTADQKRNALAEATRIADERYGHRWVGVRGTSEQALDWPRAYGTDPAGNEIDDAVVPTKLQQWVARAALAYAAGTLTASDEEPTVLSETLTSASGASRSVTYTSPRRQDTEYVALDRMLVSAGLISAASGWGYTEA